MSDREKSNKPFSKKYSYNDIMGDVWKGIYTNNLSKLALENFLEHKKKGRAGGKDAYKRIWELSNPKNPEYKFLPEFVKKDLSRQWKLFEKGLLKIRGFRLPKGIELGHPYGKTAQKGFSHTQAKSWPISQSLNRSLMTRIQNTWPELQNLKSDKNAHNELLQKTLFEWADKHKLSALKKRLKMLKVEVNYVLSNGDLSSVKNVQKNIDKFLLNIKAAPSMYNLSKRSVSNLEKESIVLKQKINPLQRGAIIPINNTSSSTQSVKKNSHIRRSRNSQSNRSPRNIAISGRLGGVAAFVIEEGMKLEALQRYRKGVERSSEYREERNKYILYEFAPRLEKSIPLNANINTIEREVRRHTNGVLQGSNTPSRPDLKYLTEREFPLVVNKILSIRVGNYENYERTRKGGVFQEGVLPWYRWTDNRLTARKKYKRILSKRVTRVEGVRLVVNPSDHNSTIITKLPKNTLIEVTNKGQEEKFNKNAPVKSKWWEIRVLVGNKRYSGKKGWLMKENLTIPKYHTGGIVGRSPVQGKAFSNLSLGAKEQLAVLEKGELVIPKGRVKELLNQSSNQFSHSILGENSRRADHLISTLTIPQRTFTDTNIINQTLTELGNKIDNLSQNSHGEINQLQQSLETLSRKFEQKTIPSSLVQSQQSNNADGALYDQLF